MTTEKWASLEDFATLFGYFWHRDFPIDPKHPGAHRADWTKHIDRTVKNISDLFGYYSRYEWIGEKGDFANDIHKSDGPKDAVIRDASYQDLIALEWEWEEHLGNEIDKLKEYAIKIANQVDKKTPFKSKN